MLNRNCYFNVVLNGLDFVFLVRDRKDEGNEFCLIGIVV